MAPEGFRELPVAVCAAIRPRFLAMAVVTYKADVPQLRSRFSCSAPSARFARLVENDETFENECLAQMAAGHGS